MESTNDFSETIANLENDSLSIISDIYRITIGSEQTSGAYSLVDMLIPPNVDSLPHSHRKFQEAFYIIDGEIEVITKGRKYTEGKSSHVKIPFNGPGQKL